ncbi:MAG: hypothetical protein M1819_003147 [Sarea resinae]|nr:MAG: hypothetical protein M1819_003147 [Sarea resinae]
MSDYNKLKVDELRALLKDRSLSHQGNKADLIARLRESDASTTSAPAPASGTTAAAPEDEIDWEDDAVADAAKTTSEPNAAALAAGGQGQVDNPTAVPNQQVDTDPSTTADLTVKGDAAPVSDPAVVAAAGENTKPAEPAADVTPAPPPVDYSRGLATSSLDDELEKRKKRASRFGIQESDEDALKALERAKRFGTGTAGEQEVGKGVKGLDEALPERMNRKRGREGGDDAGRGQNNGNKRRQDGGRRGDRRRGRAPGGGDAGVRKPNGSGSGLSEADRKKAEERKRRFATAA